MDRITGVENGQKIFPENSTGSLGGKNTFSNVLKGKVVNDMNINQKTVRQSMKEIFECQTLQNVTAPDTYDANKKVKFQKMVAQMKRAADDQCLKNIIF